MTSTLSTVLKLTGHLPIYINSTVAPAIDITHRLWWCFQPAEFANDFPQGQLVEMGWSNFREAGMSWIIQGVFLNWWGLF